MQYAIVDPELPKVVEFIFKKILTTHMTSDTNYKLYTNYMKALVRVGLQVAPSEWNKLVEQHLGNKKGNPFQITVEDVTNADTRFNEEGIARSYANIVKIDDVLRDKVHEFLSPPRNPLQEAKGSPTESPRSSKELSGAGKYPVRPVTAPVVDLPADAPPLLSSHRPKTG
jgi:hypothetical protein